MNQDLDIQLEKAIYGLQGKGNWKYEAAKVFRNAFPDLDFSRIEVINWFGKGKDLISLRVDWLETQTGAAGIIITPSALTHYEAEVLAFLFNRLENESVVAATFNLIKIVKTQPDHVDPKQINILSKWAKEKNLFSISELSRKDGIVLLEIQHTYGKKPGISSLLETWSIKDIAGYILSTGNLPSPQEARELSLSTRQEGR